MPLPHAVQALLRQFLEHQDVWAGCVEALAQVQPDDLALTVLTSCIASWCFFDHLAQYATQAWQHSCKAGAHAVLTCTYNGMETSYGNVCYQSCAASCQAFRIGRLLWWMSLRKSSLHLWIAQLFHVTATVAT